jgi:hypothetical protein
MLLKFEIILLTFNSMKVQSLSFPGKKLQIHIELDLFLIRNHALLCLDIIFCIYQCKRIFVSAFCMS